MNHFNSNRQNKTVWTQADSTCADADDRPQADDTNIIPFPGRPTPAGRADTGKTADLLQDAESSEITEALEELALIDWMIY